MLNQKYSSAAKLFHWAIALLLAFQMALGWRMKDLPRGMELFSAAQLHKSVGILILLLTLGRVGLRYLNPPPPLMADSIWAARLAKGVHHLLYVFMIGAPLTGWIIVSTARTKFETLLFGVVPWPHLPFPDSWHEPAEGLHGLLATVGMALFLLHVVGALRHQFVKGENVLGRMIPFMTTRPVSLGKGVAVAFGAVFAMWLAHGAGWQWPLNGAGDTTVSNPAPPSVEQNVTSPLAPPVQDEGATLEKDPEKAAAEDEGEGDEDKTATMPLSAWSVAPGGRLGFTTSWSGTPIEGSFGKWTPTIRFSPDALDKSSIRVVIDLTSAGTGDSQRDEALQGAEFFNTATNPRAVFEAKSVTAAGKDRYKANGTLSLNGRSRPVALDFTLKIKGDDATVSGSTRLDRTSFAVGTGEWASTDQIAGPVGIRFSLSARRQN